MVIGLWSYLSHNLSYSYFSLALSASPSHQMITHLLFPVEASSVAVGDVNVTIGLENGELQAT